MLIWSERRGPRVREVVADVATFAWLALWLILGVRLYVRLAELAGAGRLIRDGGARLMDAGGELSGALESVPFVGVPAADRVQAAFGATAQPVIRFGTDLEQLLVVIAALLGLLVVALAVIPWLNRYLPWRIARFRRLNAGARVLRAGALRHDGGAASREVERILASRALHRLEYDELLRFTPDPFGDWQTGRFDRLVQAELETIGLKSLVARRPSPQ